MNWLSDLSMRQHHEYHKSIRITGTGDWLLNNDVFRQWRAAESSSFLWLHGIGECMVFQETISCERVADKTCNQRGLARPFLRAYFPWSALWFDGQWANKKFAARKSSTRSDRERAPATPWPTFTAITRRNSGATHP